MVPAPTTGWPLQRTCAASEDLDWLPAEVKALRWGVAAAIWSGMASVVALITILTKGQFFIYWGKGLAALAVGGYYAGDRAARSVMRSRLARLARGATDLSSFSREADGELLHVRGRVRVRQTVPSVLRGEQRAVYRRVLLQLGGVRAIHEAAVDFMLEDHNGEQALVQVAGARLIVPDPRRVPLEEEPALLTELPLPARFVEELEERRAKLARGKQVDAIRVGEALLREGDEVELVGYKTRTVDVTMADRLARETPLRATLRSGKEMPLLIAPLDRRGE